MNCRPGDLARIVGTDVRLGLNDRIVKLTNDAPKVVAGRPHWRLEEPIRVVLSMAGINPLGQVFERGECLIARFLDDANLRPIRDPGADAVDEMVRLVGAAPKTLTEIMREVTDA